MKEFQLYYYSFQNGDLVRNAWVRNRYYGSDGKMLTNTVTPDRFHVGADGLWDGIPAQRYVILNFVTIIENTSRRLMPRGIFRYYKR